MTGAVTKSAEPQFAGPARGPRFAALDGVRGLAILAVVLYHYYSRWPNFPNLYVSWFSRGYVGVQLFFLLSGYLIFRTIERCPSYMDFLYRRWLRLFPAMLVASGLILASSVCLYRRVEGIPGLYDVLPGLLFFDPDWMRGLLHLPVTGAIEGDFWTLFTEVKFYALFGAAFFLIGRRAVWLLAGVTALGVAVWALELSGTNLAATPVGRWLLFTTTAVNAPCYGWFSAGAFLYLYFESAHRTHLVGSVFSATLGVFANLRPGDGISTLCLVAVYAVFIAPFFIPLVGRFFSRPFWVFLGFISYPLYLLHENAGWAIIRSLHQSFPAVFGLLLPIVPLVAIGAVAWLVAAFAEPLLRDLLTGYGGMTLRARFSSSRLNACALLALLTAVAVGLGSFGQFRSGRRVFEAEVLGADRAALQPLEAALAQDQAALENVRQARRETEKALDAIISPKR